MEQFHVVVDGQKRTICGITLETTCNEVKDALCQATAKTSENQAIYEVWSSFERLVGADELLLQLREEWGLYQGDVTFFMKPRTRGKPIGPSVPCVRASKLRRTRGCRGVPPRNRSEKSPSGEQIKKLYLQKGQIRNQRHDIGRLERDLATLRDAVDRLQLTEEERSELSDLRALSEKPQSELEEMKVWELNVQAKEKETTDREIEQLEGAVSLRKAELDRYREEELRLLAKVRVKAETQRQEETNDMEIELQIKTLSEELQSRLKSKAVKVLFISHVCISSRDSVLSLFVGMSTLRPVHSPSVNLVHAVAGLPFVCQCWYRSPSLFSLFQSVRPAISLPFV